MTDHQPIGRFRSGGHLNVTLHGEGRLRSTGTIEGHPTMTDDQPMPDDENVIDP